MDWAVYGDWLAFTTFYGMFILLAMTFYTAYFAPGQMVTIFVNRFGEANLEGLVVIPLLSGFGAIVLLYKTRNLFSPGLG